MTSDALVDTAWLAARLDAWRAGRTATCMSAFLRAAASRRRAAFTACFALVVVLGPSGVFEPCRSLKLRSV